MADWLDEGGDPARAEFVRAQVEMARCPADRARWAALGARERELFLAHGARWAAGLPGLGDAVTLAYPLCAAGGGGARYAFRRGLVAHAEVPCAVFLAPDFAARLFAAHPVTSVRLTDKRPFANGASIVWSSGGEPGPVAGEWRLPAGLFDRLRGYTHRDWGRASGVELRYYSSEPDGLASLSAACVVFAREAAGLAPLPDDFDPEVTSDE